MKNYRLFPYLTISTLVLASCEFFGGTPLFSSETPRVAKITPRTPAPEPTTTDVPVVTRSVPELSDISLSWKAPDGAVDGFIIRYGSSRDTLASEVKVSIANLQATEDLNHDKVFTYLLRGVSRTKTIFVSIASYRGENLSPQSVITEVPPG